MPDFAGDQVRVTFGGGQSTVNVGPGIVVVSDEFTLAQVFDASKNYVISGYFGTAAPATVSCSNYTGGRLSHVEVYEALTFPSSTNDSGSTVPALGYALFGPSAFLVAKLEVMALPP